MSLTHNNHQSEKKHTVLYIDDDQALHQLVQFIFDRREDLHLITAETGTAGIKMAIKYQPKIILLDLCLPDMDGYVVLEQLQTNRSTSHIPVIAVSGNSMPEDVEIGMNAGLDGYITKPIVIEELYGVIDKIIYPV